MFLILKSVILIFGRGAKILIYIRSSRLKQDGQVIDEVIQPLGLRKYEAVAGKGFFLNGKKYPMYGVTRHQDWWGMGSALTNREHDFDLEQIMKLGGKRPCVLLITSSRIISIHVVIRWDLLSGLRFLL